MEASIYGKRSGAIHGLAVIHKEKSNIVRGSKGWKLGCVHDVQMLSRGAMFKPEVSKLHIRLTDYIFSFEKNTPSSSRFVYGLVLIGRCLC